MGVVISQEEFQALRDEETIPGFDYKIQEHIFKILKKYPNQLEPITVDFDTHLPAAQQDIYESFGIQIDSSRMVRDSSLRQYLLIVEPATDPEVVKAQCEKFISENLPLGTSPDYFVVNKSIDTYEEMVEWNSLIMDWYPDSIPLPTFGNLKREHGREENLKVMLKELDDLQVNIIDIKDDLVKLDKAYTNLNRTTLSTLKEIERSALAQYTGKELLFNSGDNRNHVGIVSAYLFYKHGIVPHLTPNDTQGFLNRLSPMMFSTQYMLAEDQLLYLQQLPDVLMRFNEGLQFLIFVDKPEFRCRVRVSYIEADDPESSDLNATEFDLSALQIIPLRYEYDMSGNDISRIRPVHDKLLGLFKILERKLNKFDSVVDVTNTFFFERNQKRCVGHIDSINLRMPALIYPVHNELSLVYNDFSLQDISSMFPVNVLPGYKEPVKKIISDVRRISKYPVKNLKIYKHAYPIASILSYFYNKGPNLLNLEDTDFVAAGLGWYETYRYRARLLREILSEIDLQEFRKRSNFISVFGGPHPMLREEFVITEDVLKE